MCRQELFLQPYDTINWAATRMHCAPEDLHNTNRWLQRALWGALSWAEWWFQWPLEQLRRRALEEVMVLVKHEDDNTNHVTIGPVQKALQMMVRYFDDPTGEGFLRCAHIKGGNAPGI
jgi:hypothetical protein